MHTIDETNECSYTHLDTSIIGRPGNEGELVSINMSDNRSDSWVIPQDGGNHGALHTARHHRKPGCTQSRKRRNEDPCQPCPKTQIRPASAVCAMHDASASMHFGRVIVKHTARLVEVAFRSFSRKSSQSWFSEACSTTISL